MTTINKEDNGKKGKFTIYEDEETAGEMTYTWAGEKRFIIDHTIVDDKFRGKDYGKQLVMKAVEFAREQNLKILPLCPYAKRVLESDENLQDVLF